MKKVICTALIFLFSIIFIALIFGVFQFMLLGDLELRHEFGFDKDDYIIIDEYDSHGGLQGEGSYRLIMDCSQSRKKALKRVAGWNRLPLSENLRLIMYGGEKNGVEYAYDLASDAKIPEINNGFYKFINRNPNAADKYSDDIFAAHSFNFSLAIYDLDADILYYYKYDT